jgi:hypothetical protein
VGPQGPAGPKGASGVSITADRFFIVNGDIGAGTASSFAKSYAACGNDAVLISGGCLVDGTLSQFGVEPYAGSFRYFCSLKLGAATSVRAHAYCMDTSP